MTGKERLTRLFTGKEIDRTPIWFQFPYFRSKYYANIFETESYKPILGDISKYSEIIDRQVFDTGIAFTEHPDIKRDYRQYAEGEYSVSEMTITYKDIKLKSILKKGKSGTILEPFIKEIDDLDKIMSLPYQQPVIDLSDFKQKELKLGDIGLMGVDLADPLSVLHNMCDESEFTIFVHCETEKVTEFLDCIFKRIYDTYKYMLENGAGPVYWISGAEFAVPPMISPIYFDELVVKHTKKLCDLIRSYGCYSMLHCHGKIGNVLSGLKNIGFDSIHPIEAPPMGDCTLAKAREVFGKDTILVGNIQYGDLWEKTEEEMEYLVQTALKEGAETGRFILATTGGPSAPEINDNVVKNYRRIIKTVIDN